MSGRLRCTGAADAAGGTLNTGVPSFKAPSSNALISAAQVLPALLEEVRNEAVAVLALPLVLRIVTQQAPRDFLDFTLPILLPVAASAKVRRTARGGLPGAWGRAHRHVAVKRCCKWWLLRRLCGCAAVGWRHW